MELDMTAFATSETLTNDVDFDVEQFEVLHSWREHTKLHDWMEELYFAKGGCSVLFHCTNLGVSMVNVDRLDAAIRLGALYCTNGFIVGISGGFERDRDLDFISKARTTIQDGKRIFYRPWWR